MSRFMKGEREQQHRELDENLRKIDVQALQPSTAPAGAAVHVIEPTLIQLPGRRFRVAGNTVGTGES